MTNVLELKVTAREVSGKSAHKLAPEGLVPAVVYGPKIDTLSLAVNRRDFEHLMRSATVGSSLIDLAIEGQDTSLDVIGAHRLLGRGHGPLAADGSADHLRGQR